MPAGHQNPQPLQLSLEGIYSPVATRVASFSISNRRYLGSKFKLGPFIKAVIKDNCPSFESFADLFAGTGAVSFMFRGKRLIINDILCANHVCHIAWFSPEHCSKAKLEKFATRYASPRTPLELSGSGATYMAESYGDTYFSESNCRTIGFIRQDIEDNFAAGLLNKRERCVLLTSLIYAADKIANTCGHYDAYRKNGDLDKKLTFALPAVDFEGTSLNADNELYVEDAKELARRLCFDVVYLDPPYNSRQYCTSYHVLENLTRWQKPRVFGVARKHEMPHLKSDWCTQKASAAFEDLILHLDAHSIVLSYNNMAQKGNERSNAKITDEQIMSILSQRGKTQVFSTKYKAFSAGKPSAADAKQNEERLFVCNCR